MFKWKFTCAEMHSLISNVTYCPNALPISKTCSVWSDNIHKLYEGSQDTIWLWRLFWISEPFLTLNTCNAFSLFFLHKVLSPASLLILQYLQQQLRLEMMSFTFASFQFSFLFKDCMWRNLRAEIKKSRGCKYPDKAFLWNLPRPVQLWGQSNAKYIIPHIFVRYLSRCLITILCCHS